MNKIAVINTTITEANENQRMDNFLVTQCKGVPKARIYRALRKGEVRVNRKRVKPEYRLRCADVVRIPPLRMTEKKAPSLPPQRMLQQIESSILQETKQFMVVDKPAGMPVHGGTGIKAGLIEAIRVLRPQCKFLELAHRLDRETSGCLLLVKKRSILAQIHECWRAQRVKKHYVALLQGRWLSGSIRGVRAPLRKNHLANGERIVVVDEEEGRPSETIFRPLRQFDQAVLVEATIITGRTHQIRVHAAHIGHPLAGDDKYGDREFNHAMKQKGLKRLFLHASSIYCPLADIPEESIGLCVLLPDELQRCLQQLKSKRI
ncbi:MAG: 23S rRNA pseudouridine(955/2504/2580) synthase [Coxiella sp. RIFCSPHIGHO2_12_FULL_42_15]|nr:MAG: 23S rRNA pseudouridine(955/2504/2580) synthase [Coxiella sp. RIFCSPHIGHO2_12_FULL_42_15]